MLGLELNIYATPAIFTLILLIIETVYLIVALPETRGLRLAPEECKIASKGCYEPEISRYGSVEERLRKLEAARRLHFMFMCAFSGLEFTLTFLTYDRTFYDMFYFCYSWKLTGN
jgi:hypothetical protein